MRLFLLPVSTKRSLIYCQRLNRQITSETTYADKLTTRASNTWLNWEKAENGWKKKVTTYGNKLFARIPHEEWGLKSVPPLSKRREDKELKGGKEVSVLFPSSVISKERVREALENYSGDERRSFHTKWMWASIIGMPISAPVALVPVLPNLPFFYLCFRAWSHWKARSGSQHIDFLLKNRLLKLTPSPGLDIAYAEGGLDVSMKELESEVKNVLEKQTGGHSVPKTDPEAERILLTQSSGKYVAAMVEVPGLEEHVQRAVKQIERSLSAKQEFKEEKKELERANKAADTKR